MIGVLKIKIKLFLRFMDDVFQGNYFRFAKKSALIEKFEFQVNIAQEIKPSETYDNKVFNLSLAASRINEYVILPNQVFSFWKMVGNPNQGFKKGRTLIHGKLSEENGGGLCQVSGILHHLCLQYGLEITERFNHSKDIYTDETRFAPLGTDATVVYGYKDFRFKNSFNFPIKISIQIVENQILAQIMSPVLIHKKQLFYELKELKEAKIVVVKDENQLVLNQSVYTI